jgi:hypothetical protein
MPEEIVSSPALPLQESIITKLESDIQVLNSAVGQLIEVSVKWTDAAPSSAIHTLEEKVKAALAHVGVDINLFWKKG